jgi:hypothetical protein
VASAELRTRRERWGANTSSKYQTQSSPFTRQWPNTDAQNNKAEIPRSNQCDQTELPKGLRIDRERPRGCTQMSFEQSSFGRPERGPIAR